MSLLTYGAILSFLSSTLVVLTNGVQNVEVIRHNGSNPVADAFSVPKCFASYCTDQGTTCYDGGCCKCKCPSVKANYIVNEKKCFSRVELNQMNSTKCEYSIRMPGEPLLAIPLTEGMVQNVSFTDREDHRTIIECSRSVQVGWEYRDAFGEWKEGDGNIFTVISYDKPGSINQRVIETLKWSGNINSFYSGLFIRLLFKCENNVQGCALAKTSGQHTYDTTSTEKPPPALLTTASTPVTTSSTPGTITRITENNTKTNPGDDETPAPNKENAAVIYGSIFGALGLICIIVVVIVVVTRYRKKKQNQKDREANSVANLEEYKDPIYDDIKGNFDNPMYADPTLNLKRKQLGPLPNIPGADKPDEAPSTLFRTSPDYDNPPFGMQSSDYDNPPFSGGKQRTGSNYNSQVEDSMDSTGDHDIPPVKDELENSEHYASPPRKYDYDSQSELGEDTAM